MPKEKDIEKGMFYAVYYDKPSTYYWGRVEKTFQETEDSEVTQAEIKFLKRSVPSSNPRGLRWDWPLEDDVDIIEVSRILAGPAKPMVENKSAWKATIVF